MCMRAKDSDPLAKSRSSLRILFKELTQYRSSAILSHAHTLLLLLQRYSLSSLVVASGESGLDARVHSSSSDSFVSLSLSLFSGSVFCVRARLSNRAESVYITLERAHARGEKSLSPAGEEALSADFFLDFADFREGERKRLRMTAHAGVYQSTSRRAREREKGRIPLPPSLSLFDFLRRCIRRDYIRRRKRALRNDRDYRVFIAPSPICLVLRIITV